MEIAFDANSLGIETRTTIHIARLHIHMYSEHAYSTDYPRESRRDARWTEGGETTIIDSQLQRNHV